MPGTLKGFEMLKGFEVGAFYSDTNGSSRYYTDRNGYNIAQSAWVFCCKKTF